MNDILPVSDYVEMGIKNDAICKSFGFTGRLFVNEYETLNIIEGPHELNESYFQAIVNDPRSTATLRHFSRQLESREFHDYSVWAAHSQMPHVLPKRLNLLCGSRLDQALVPNLSLKVRLIIDGYVRANLLSAA